MVTKIFLLVLGSIQVLSVKAFNLQMSPLHVRLPDEPQTVNFMCKADVALSGCQYTLKDGFNLNGTSSPLLDLSQGSQSPVNSSYPSDEIDSYSYSGRGLEAGDCGISLRVHGWSQLFVACRVRAETGGWYYDWASFYSDQREALPLTMTPREAVVLPGGEATFMLKTPEQLDWCSYSIANRQKRFNFNKGEMSEDNTYHHRYHGTGPKNGECGLKLANVIELDNGPVRIMVMNIGWTMFDHVFITVIVAHPPSTPVLKVIQEGDSFTATCEVKESRPIAEMSWMLDDRVIRHDALDDSPGYSQDEWRWPWMQGTLMQRLRLRLEPKHDRQIIKCRVSHVALDKPLEVTKSITFTEAVGAVSFVTTAGTPATPDVDPRITRNPTCKATAMLGLLCQDSRVEASQLGNPSCPTGELYKLRVRETNAGARTAELKEEQAQVMLEAAKVSLEANKMILEAEKLAVKAKDARLISEAAQTQENEAWAENAKEELESQSGRHNQSLLLAQTS